MRDNFVIARLALETPVRRYRIEAVLRQKPLLEAPAEACLRALLVADRLSESALVQYLGLSVGEFDVIASELLGQNLVRRSGPDLMLTPFGKQALEPNAEGQKRTKATATLAFEESAFAEAPRGRSKPWMKRIAPGEVRDDGRSEAATAFREGFWAWRARERDQGDKGQVKGLDDALARVVSVVPLGRETGVIKAPVALAPASNAAFIDVSEIQLGSIASPLRRETCAERFQETVKATLSPQDGAAALEWISKKIGSVPGNPLIGPVSWARQTRLGELISPEGTLLVAETAPSFISRGELRAWLEQAKPETKFDESGEGAKVVIWSPPEGDTWRLDADIDAAGARLQAEVSAPDDDNPGLVAAIFRLRKGSEKEIEQAWNIERHGEPFGAALLYSTVRNNDSLLPPGVGEDLPQALELIVRPGCWALAIAHLPTDRAPIPIPVGIASTNPLAVEEIVNALRVKVLAARDNDWCASGGRTGAVHAAARVAQNTQDGFGLKKL
jgi:hypothetical protein